MSNSHWSEKHDWGFEERFPMPSKTDNLGFFNSVWFCIIRAVSSWWQFLDLVFFHSFYPIGFAQSGKSGATRDPYGSGFRTKTRQVRRRDGWGGLHTSSSSKRFSLRYAITDPNFARAVDWNISCINLKWWNFESFRSALSISKSLPPFSKIKKR